MTIHSALPNPRTPSSDLSHVRGFDDEPLSNACLHELLAQAVQRWPERDAAIFCAEGIRWSWAQFQSQVNAAAAALHALGVQRGDRVGIWSPNRSEWLVTQFATARLGAILVNINPAYRVAELAYALNKASVSVLVSASRFKTSDYLGMLVQLGFGAADTQLPTLRHVIRLGAGGHADMLDWSTLMAQGHTRLPDAQSLNAHHAINIQFTSGTTGAPKGATLTHHNIVNNAIAVAACMRLSEQDRLCIPVPLYHCFGMVLSVLACTSVGAAMVFPGEGFDPVDTLAAVQAERCTALHGVPTMFIAELDHPEFSKFDLSTLRTGIMAGAPCPIEVMRRVQSLMHMREVTIAYGMTETSPVSFQSATDDPLDKRVTTVGRVLPHLEVRIVDTQGQTVPIGETGELCTRGYSVMQGYWDEPERTADTIQDGWMHTGDLATMDAEGYCNIVGRLKDMVIRGGENIYPREIEEFLFRHPKIAAVQVFGVPDERYGEQLCAWVVQRPGADCTEQELRTFCEQNIAHFKVPRYIRLVEELPVTVTGKPQKFLMREAMVAELGLNRSASA
jgi:fatty-acyl-CoA synthase